MDNSKKISRETFLEKAGMQLAQVRTKLATLHGAPPCMHTIDTITLKSWPDSKRTETLSRLQDSVQQAESILQEARRERTLLWEQSDALPDDRQIPALVEMKQIHEDLEAYEDHLNFVNSKHH